MSLDKALAKLQSEMKKENQIGEWVKMTQERINQFAEVTGDFQWIHNNIEKAKKYLTWEPKIKLDDGLKSTIEYFEQQVNTNNFS